MFWFDKYLHIQCFICQAQIRQCCWCNQDIKWGELVKSIGLVNGYCVKRVSIRKFILQLLYFIEITKVQNPIYGMVFLLQTQVDCTQLYSISVFCSICYTFEGKILQLCLFWSLKVLLYFREY